MKQASRQRNRKNRRLSRKRKENPMQARAIKRRHLRTRQRGK